MATPATATGSQQFQGFDPEKFKKLFGQGFNFGQFGQQGQGFQGGFNFQTGGGFPQMFGGGQQFAPQGGQQFQGFQGQPQISGGFPQTFGGGQQYMQSQQPQGQGGSFGLQDLSLGNQGRVNVDPRTGEPIPFKDRQKPFKYLTEQLVTGPAIQEAQDFQFTDLPASIARQGGQIDLLTGAAQQVLGQGGQALGQGAQTIGTSIESLLGTRGSLQRQAGSEAQTREQALQELAQLQRQALAPNLDPQQRALFQQRADARRAEVQNIEGGLVDAFSRGRASDLAKLSSQGVIDSTTAENALAERERRLAQDIFSLEQQANEASRQELLGERSRIGETATEFGQLQGLQAAQTGDILANLLGTEAGIGGQLGQLGVGQQGIGAELAGLGISGLGTSGELGLAARGQEADLQQAALSTRLLGNQLGLQNIQSLLNQRLGRQATKQEMDLMKQLVEQQLGGGGFFGGLGSFLSGGLLGGFLGSQYGGRKGE